MGYQVVAYALDKMVRPASVKLVFIGLAGNADNETGEAFPSIKSLCQVTSQDRKTVIKGISRLLTSGLIEDTGRRRGRSQRVKVYRVVGAPFKTVPKSELSVNSPKFPNKTVPNFPGDSPKFPNKTVPNFPGDSSENGTRNQSGINQKESEKESGPCCPQGGPGAGDFLIDFREAKALICQLILDDIDRPWREKTEAQLAKMCQLPGLPRSEIETIGWFRRLSKSDYKGVDPELQARRDPITPSTLIEYWADEFQRAHAYHVKKRGLSAGERRAEKKMWPERAEEFLRSKHGPKVHLPETFGDLPADVREEWKLEHEEWERTHPPEWVTAYEELWGKREDMPAVFSDLTVTQQDSVRKQMEDSRESLGLTKTTRKRGLQSAV